MQLRKHYRKLTRPKVSKVNVATLLQSKLVRPILWNGLVIPVKR
jgi:hypothetical protein